MHWQLWVAVLLLAWNTAPSRVEAARTKNVELLQLWEPQTLTPIKSGQHGYPSYIQSTVPRGGYNRRRRLPSRFKAASTTTTERPFIRVWNSFVRSVQPNFGLRNFTNPLTNFFNANIIETVPLQAEIYNNQQEQQQQLEEEEEQSNSATTQSPNKRKRKRRKQQKRRPSYDSVEQDDPYDYYGSAQPQSMPHAQQEPMFYYNPNYYDVRHLQGFNDYSSQFGQHYYDQFFEDRPSEEEHTQYTPEDDLGKKLTVLRPLALAIQLPSDSSSSSSSESAAAAIRTEDLVSTAANEDVDAVVDTKAEGNHDLALANDDMEDDDDHTSTLSESMRNAIGMYMRDDQRNRERQRQSERRVESVPLAKAKPRKFQRFLLAGRLSHAPNNHQ